MEIKIRIEPHFLGDYHLEYDGKTISLYGKNKNEPLNQIINNSGKNEYEPVILIPVVTEIRNANPTISKVDDEYIYINLDIDKNTMEQRKILMIDLDGVVANFAGAVASGKVESEEGFYLNLEPLPNAIESVRKLAEVYDCFILSTPSWSKPHSWIEKRLWVEKHFGDLFFKKVILTHRKDLVIGDYLIDDHTWNGADKFTGELIHLTSDKFPNWESVLRYLLPKAEQSTMKGRGLGALFSTEDIEASQNGNGQTHNQSKNTMTTETKKPYEQVLKELKENIAIQLDLCEPTSTPTICSMKATPEGYKKLEDMMIELIADGGKTISQAIIDVERAFNPNMIQD